MSTRAEEKREFAALAAHAPALVKLARKASMKQTELASARRRLQEQKTALYRKERAR